MLQRLFHVNICVRDMERSIRFYQDLGFNKVNDFMLDDPSVGDALGLKAKKLRGVFMRLGNEPNAPVLDLVVHRSAHTRPALPDAQQRWHLPHRLHGR